MAVSQKLVSRVSESNGYDARWFHPIGLISGKEAEELLTTKGCVGSFLVHKSRNEPVRKSRNEPDNYTLSVRRARDIIHVQIYNNGDYYEIETGDEFASLTELISYYTEQGNPLKEKNGNLIEAKYPLYNTEIHSSDPWFHGRLDGKLAETLLIQHGFMNSFLVRERSTVPGEFALCILTSPHVVTNLRVLCQADFVEYRFPSLLDLVEHHKKKPIVEASGVLLGKPLVVAAASPKHLANQTSNLSATVAPNSSSEKHLEEFEQDYLNKSSRTEGKKTKTKQKNRNKNILSRLIALKDFAARSAT